MDKVNRSALSGVKVLIGIDAAERMDIGEWVDGCMGEWDGSEEMAHDVRFPSSTHKPIH